MIRNAPRDAAVFGVDLGKNGSRPSCVDAPCGSRCLISDFSKVGAVMCSVSLCDRHGRGP